MSGTTPEGNGGGDGMPRDVGEVAAQEAARKTSGSDAGAQAKADHLRDRWRAQKRRQRARVASGGGVEPPGTTAPPRRAPSVGTPDPRLLERVARMVAVFERRGSHVLAGSIAGAVQAGYPALPLTQPETASLVEATDIYVEIRSKDLLEWLVANPRVAQWLPEIVLGGCCVGLIVPRAVTYFRARRAGLELTPARPAEPPPAAEGNGHA